VRAQSGGRTGFRDGNEGVRFFVVVQYCMDTQNDAAKRRIGNRFRAIAPACLPGSIRSYGAKLRQKTKLTYPRELHEVTISINA
jgi:hypothetical protein